MSIVGALGTLLGLIVAREKAPLNLGLLYAFATFEGLALGLILKSYVASGWSGVVLNAAVTTAAVTLAAGAHGYTTKRDLSGIGGILTAGLIGVIVASIVGIFVQLPLLYVGLSVVAARGVHRLPGVRPEPGCTEPRRDRRRDHPADG